MNFFSLFKRKLIYSIKKKKLIDKDNFKSTSLDELFHHYGSDKANLFKISGKKGHGYSKFYENKLEKFKNKKINILEIGSYSGASAAAFVKYFSDVKVFCLDINISNFIYKSKNIDVYGIDIKDEISVIDTLKKIYNLNQINNFDIIIDDGSHNLSDILLGIKIFFRHLKKEGIFIIEDFKHPNYYEYNRNIDHILIDEILKNINEKKFFSSDIITEDFQSSLFESVEKIETFKGNLSDSDICFLSKKWII